MNSKISLNSNNTLQEGLFIETEKKNFYPLFPERMQVPASVSLIFSTAADRQDAVLIHILAGTGSNPDEFRSLGRFSFSGFPPGARGVPQIEVSFDVSASGIFSLKAKDLATGKIMDLTNQSKIKVSEEGEGKMATFRCKCGNLYELSEHVTIFYCPICKMESLVTFEQADSIVAVGVERFWKRWFKSKKAKEPTLQDIPPKHPRPHIKVGSKIEDEAIVEGTKVIATNNIDKFISICDNNRMGMLKYPIDKIEDVVERLIIHFKARGASIDFIMASSDLRVFCPNDAYEFSYVHLDILNGSLEKLGLAGRIIITDKPHSYGFECPNCGGKDALFFFDNWDLGQISEKDLDALTQYYKYSALLSLQEKNAQSIPCKICEKLIDASNSFLVTHGHTSGTFMCKDCFAKQYWHKKESFLKELRDYPHRIGRSQLRNARNYVAGIFEKTLFPPRNL
jgi:hypothetical protein